MCRFVLILAVFFLALLSLSSSITAVVDAAKKKPKYVELNDLMIDIARRMCSKLGPLIKVPEPRTFIEYQRHILQGGSVDKNGKAITGTGAVGGAAGGSGFNWETRCDLLYESIERVGSGIGDAMVNELDLTQQDLVDAALYPQNYYDLVAGLKTAVKSILTISPTYMRLAEDIRKELPSSSANNDNKDSSSNGVVDGKQAPVYSRELEEQRRKLYKFQENDIDLFLHRTLSSFILKAATQDRGVAETMKDLPREANKNALAAGIKLPTYGFDDVDELDEENFLTGQDVAWVQNQRFDGVEEEEIKEEAPLDTTTEEEDERLIDELSSESWLID